MWTCHVQNRLKKRSFIRLYSYWGANPQGKNTQSTSLKICFQRPAWERIQQVPMMLVHKSAFCGRAFCRAAVMLTNGGQICHSEHSGAVSAPHECKRSTKPTGSSVEVSWVIQIYNLLKSLARHMVSVVVRMQALLPSPLHSLMKQKDRSNISHAILHGYRRKKKKTFMRR